MSELVWTKEKPTKEGWYWVRFIEYYRERERLSRPEIWYCDGENIPLFIAMQHLPWKRKDIEILDRFYAGPIPEPALMKEEN